MFKKLFCLFSLSFFITGCYNNHLYVQVENIKNDYLASTQVDTPDFRRLDPPFGQRINISWSFPKNLYYQDLSGYLTVRFWNNTQQTKVFNIDKRVGTSSFYFSNKSKDKKNRILTYRIQIVNRNGEVVETWKHHFWTELINIDEQQN